MENAPLDGTNKDTSVGKDYSSVTNESKKPTSVGKDYSNEMQEKEQPEIIHFEDKTLKNQINSIKSWDVGNFTRLVLTKDSVKPTVGRKRSHKLGKNYSNLETKQDRRMSKINPNLIKRPSSVDRTAQFNPFSRIETVNHNSTSLKLESKPQSNTVNGMSSKRTTIVNGKIKSQEGINFSKIVKRVERLLRKSRISSHNDLRRMRKLVYDLRHISRVQPSPETNDSNVLVLNATEGINSRLSGIEKRMYVADGNEILNNITAVLVQLVEKVQNSDGKVNSTAKPTEGVNNVPKEWYGHNGHHHLKMADMVHRMKHLEKVFQKHLKKEKLTTCKIASSTLDQMTLTGGFDHLNHISQGAVNGMDQCIAKCCVSKVCDLAFLKKSECYGIDCKHQKCLLSPVINPVESSVALLTKRISANIGFTGIPIGTSLTDKCEVQPHIITDSVLGQGGLKGNATVLEHVTDTWSCGMECCKVTTCNVAMIQEGVCYIISCLSDGPCFEFERSSGQKTSLAFVRRSKSKVPILQPSLSLEVEGSARATLTHVSMYTHQPVLSSITKIPSPASSRLYSSPTSTKKKHSSYYYNPANEPTQPLSKPNGKDLHSNMALENSKSNHRHKISTLTNATNSPNTCVQTFPVSNVTLRAGFSTGNFKFQGKFPDPLTCVNRCCRTNDCNVAFVLQNMCFLVTCSNNELCRNEPLLSNEFESSLVYIARSALEADMVKEELVPTIKRKFSNASKKSITDPKSKFKTRTNNSNAATSQNGCSVGFIASNAKFLHGFESGEIIAIGSLKGGINECVSRCCGYNGCNASLAIGEQCFLVKCYSKESCQIVQSDSRNVETSVAIVTRRAGEKSLSYLSPQQPTKKASSLNRSSHVKQEISPEKTHTRDSLKGHNSLPNEQQTLGYQSLYRNISPSLVHAQEKIASSPTPTHHITANNIQDTGNNHHALDLTQDVPAPVSVIDPSTVNHVRNEDLLDGQRGLDHNSLNLLVSKTAQKENYSHAIINLGMNFKTSSGNVEKESIPQTGNNLATSELLRKIQEGLNNLVQAKKESDNVGTVNNEIPHTSKSEFDTIGINDHHMKNLAKNIAHSKNVDISTTDTKGKGSHISESQNSENQGGGLESKNSQNSEVLGKIFRGRQHGADDSTTSTLDDLVSKMKNLSIEQGQLRKNIPEYSEIIGKIQQHLENKSWLVDNATNRGERKDSIMQNYNIKNSSILGLTKASVKHPMFQNNPLSTQKTTSIPTPKLVQSPTALVTTPSFAGLQEIRSTYRRAPTISVKLPVSVDGIYKYKNEKPNIGEEIERALENAGVIPIKPGQSLSSENVLNTEAKVLQKTSKYTNTAKPKSAGRSLIVPAAQRLLHFLEQQIRLKTAHSKDPEGPKDIAKSREQLKYSERMNGLMDDQHTLNDRMRNLESEIHQLRSQNNLHPSKSESQVKTSNAGLGVSHVKSARKGQHSDENNVSSVGEREEELTTKDDKNLLVEQLRSIVRSELSHESEMVSPTSTELHSTTIKRLNDASHAKEHEVILEHNLNRLYNHAVADMEKALESSGKDEDGLVQENVKKNHIDTKKADLLPNIRKIIDLAKSKNPKFPNIALAKPMPMTNKSVLNNNFLPGEDSSASRKGDKGIISLDKSRKTKFLDIALNKSKLGTNENSVDSKVMSGKDISTSKNEENKMIKYNNSTEDNDRQKEELVFQQPSNNFPKDFMLNKDSNLQRSPILSKETPTMNEKSPTCHHSEVQSDVTLRGGIAREGVKDGGIVVDMNECIGQCCSSTSCNVAFMLKDNCFLLPCTDTHLCQVVDLPTKSLNTKLTFVSRDSKASVELKMFDNIVKSLGLSSTAKIQNSSLNSPIKKSKLPSQMQTAKLEGNGQVARHEEIKKPLSSSSRDSSNNSTVQALLDEMNLLTSQTGSDENGPAMKTDSEKELHMFSNTKPRTYPHPNRENTSSLHKLPLKPKLCPYSEVEYNTTIQGGLAAANYKYGGKVTNINDCVQLCCESDSCSIAFMFSNECFLLVCKSENQCKSIQAASTELNPRMVRLLRTNSGKDIQRLAEPDKVLKEALNPKGISPSKKKTSEDGKHEKDSVSSCMKSDPLHHVVPEGGMQRGNYKDFGRVKSVQECVEFCCGWAKCSMAFVVLDGCFGVSCKNDCSVVPSGDLSFQSKVVYVKRRQDVLHWLNSQGTSRSTVPHVTSHTGKQSESVSNLSGDGRNQSIHPKNKIKKATNSKPDLLPVKFSTTQNTFTSKKVSSKVPSETGNLKTSENSRLHASDINQAVSDKISVSKQLALPPNISEESTISKDKRGDGIKPQINVKAAVEPKVSSRGNDKGFCVPGEVEHDVTLGGGIKAGSYTEQGEVLNMHECVEWCCKEKRCDVAMVIKGICYTVSCYERRNCVSVPVRRIQYHPSLVHVRRAKRGMVYDGYDRAIKDNDVSLQEIVEGSSRTSRIDHGSLNDENESPENGKSAIEDELVDLLTEQSLGGSDRFPIQKGKRLKKRCYHCRPILHHLKQIIKNYVIR